jgi:hypothetical protein
MFLSCVNATHRFGFSEARSDSDPSVASVSPCLIHAMCERIKHIFPWVFTLVIDPYAITMWGLTT